MRALLGYGTVFALALLVLSLLASLGPVVLYMELQLGAGVLAAVLAGLWTALRSQPFATRGARLRFSVMAPAAMIAVLLALAGVMQVYGGGVANLPLSLVLFSMLLLLVILALGTAAGLWLGTRIKR